MSELKELVVSLKDQTVGILTLLPGDRSLFAFSEEYLARPVSERFVLSQSFFQKDASLVPMVGPTQTKAPAYFSNLLPEGHLREYLAKKAGVNSVRDFGLLKLLGQDLPGAVKLELSQTALSYLEENPEWLEQEKAWSDQAVLKFSLAGVQLKFSALLEPTGGLTIPTQGMGGEWIVKLPSEKFPGVPENEFSMLELARAIGIQVPEIKLIQVSEIVGMPSALGYSNWGEKKALAVKRFDRETNSQGIQERVHIEDFAQVYGVYPEKKYQGVSYNNLVEMIAVTAGEVEAYEFIKRLVFNWMIGNGDMHLKNWSFIYPDGKTPRLAPAYDYVSTVLFMNDSTLGLSLSREKNSREISLRHWERLAERANLSKQYVLNLVQETRQQILASWDVLKKNSSMEKSLITRLSNYMESF